MSNDRIAELTHAATEAYGEMEKLLERGQDTWTPEDEKRWDELDDVYEGNKKQVGELRKQADREARAAQIAEERKKATYRDTTSVGEMRANREGRIPEMTVDDMRGVAFRSWLRPGLTNERDRWACAQLGFEYRQSEVNMRAFASGSNEGLGRSAQVYECSDLGGRITRVLEARQQGTTPDSAGGYTVPQGVMQPIEIALLQWNTARRYASVVRAGNGREIPWPTTNDTAQKGEIIAENAPANQQDVVFGQATTKPYLYSSKYVPVSIQLMQDSNESMQALLGRLLGERLGRIQEEHFTTGTGTGQPQGITVGATDSTITLGAANAPSHDEILDLKHSVDPAYRGMAAFLFHDTVLKNIKKLKDSNGQPIWRGGLAGFTADAPDTIDGDPYFVSMEMPTGSTDRSICYGDLMKYKIHDALDMVFRRLDELHALNHQVTFLAFLRTDGKLLDAGTNPVKYASNPV